MGKSVVIRVVPPLKRMVNNTQCRLDFEECNLDLLADAVIKLGEEDLRLLLRENSRRVVTDRYN